MTDTVPVRRGLLAHYDALGAIGVAIYIWLLLSADESGCVQASVSDIREAIGTGKAQVTRTLAYLEQKKRIRYERGNAYTPSEIHLLDRATVADKPKPKPGPDPYLVEYAEVINHLNSCARTGFRSTSEITRGLIRTWLDAGFTVEDFHKVIDHRVSEWRGDPKMEQYIRPETLFGKRFESYLEVAKKVMRPVRVTKHEPPCSSCDSTRFVLDENGAASPCPICRPKEKK